MTGAYRGFVAPRVYASRSAAEGSIPGSGDTSIHVYEAGQAVEYTRDDTGLATDLIMADNSRWVREPTATGALAAVDALADVTPSVLTPAELQALPTESLRRMVQANGAVYQRMIGATVEGMRGDVIPFPWQSLTYEQFGAIGDGVADDRLAIQRAWAYAAANGMTVRPAARTYRFNAPLVLVSNLRVVNDPKTVYRRGFADTGANGFSIIDGGADVSDVSFSDGTFDHTGMAGGGISFYGARVHFRRTRVLNYANDPVSPGACMGFLYGGEHYLLEDCEVWLDGDAAHMEGTGAFRCVGGAHGLAIRCRGSSGDDCFQFVTGTGAGSRNYDRSHYNCWYIDCVGTSYAARVMLAGIGGTQTTLMTCSVVECGWINCRGWANDGRSLNIKNNRSSGLIHKLYSIRCTVNKVFDPGASPKDEIVNIVADPTNGGVVPDGLAIGGIGLVVIRDFSLIGANLGNAIEVTVGRKREDSSVMLPTQRADIRVEGGVWECGKQFIRADGNAILRLKGLEIAVNGDFPTVPGMVIGGGHAVYEFYLDDVTHEGVQQDAAGIRLVNVTRFIRIRDYFARKRAGATGTTGIARVVSGGNAPMEVGNIELDPALIDTALSGTNDGKVTWTQTRDAVSENSGKVTIAAGAANPQIVVFPVPMVSGDYTVLVNVSDPAVLIDPVLYAGVATSKLQFKLVPRTGTFATGVTVRWRAKAL